MAIIILFSAFLSSHFSPSKKKAMTNDPDSKLTKKKGLTKTFTGLQFAIMEAHKAQTKPPPSTFKTCNRLRTAPLQFHRERERERERMGSRLGRRVIQFTNLPIKLLMPQSFTNITELALKTIPSASKIEIKRVLESLYGFEVEKVRTLNMEGKKKKRGGLLIAKPDYKKAYVTLKNPLSISSDLYPIRMIEEDRRNMSKQSKSSIVEEGEAKRHWLDGKDIKPERGERSGRGRGGDRDGAAAATAKFPWSGMRSGR